MSEHNMGEPVLKEVLVKNASGKRESVIDVAKNIWGDGPPKDVLAGRAYEKAHDEAVAEASHRIKLLNNELHKPGGPLADSALELIGFDKKGRLLLIQRDQEGKVSGKYLVDSDSGKIVGRTQLGHLDKWERGPGYDRAESAQLQGVVDSNTGATIIKDKNGKVHEIVDCHGDKRVYERDAKGEPIEIIITRKGKEPEHFKPASAVSGVRIHFWYREPHNPSDRSPGFTFDVQDDGSLVQHISKKTSITFAANGTIVEKQESGKEVVKRRGYNDRELTPAPPQLSA